MDELFVILMNEACQKSGSAFDPGKKAFLSFDTMCTFALVGRYGAAVVGYSDGQRTNVRTLRRCFNSTILTANFVQGHFVVYHNLAMFL